MNHKELIEEQAKLHYATEPIMQTTFIKGANFALEMDRWIEIDHTIAPDIPIEHDNRSINVILTDGEERVSYGYYNFNRQIWFWNDMAMENATHYLLQPLPKLPQ